METEPVSGGHLALPFLVAGGLAVGESIAGALVGPDLPRNNDVAGAGAAIMLFLTLAVGFIVSAIALVVQRMTTGNLPGRIAFRSCASVIAGGVIGAAAWSKPNLGPIAFLALVVAPIGLAIRWPGDDR